MKLSYEKKDVYGMLSEKERDEANKYAKEYMKFLDKSRTEYLCTKECISMLDKAGFSNINDKSKLVPGDKIYFINKDKSLFVAVIGKESLDKGINVVGSHIDSPRLDLKPMPLTEKHNMALFKTQFYGGIKKYQWMSIPLAMHGVVFNEKGDRIEVSVGDVDDDICFTITDLLPHLAYDQMSAKANEFIDAEKIMTQRKIK